MYITDLNRKREIGAHSLFVQIGSFNILFDCGTSPRAEGLNSLPDFNIIKDVQLDLVIISHCHLDHIGALPVLMRKQKQARILMSEATRMLFPRIMDNSISVMKMQRDELGIKEYPLYTATDVQSLDEHILPMPFTRTRTIKKGDDSIDVTFFSAGHISGASSVMLSYKHRQIFFTGDVLFRDQLTLSGAAWPTDKIDTMVIETTRGCTERLAENSVVNEIEKLLTTIRTTIDNGGSVLIPSFAMGRMQEMLKMVNIARKEGNLQTDFPIYCSGLGLGLVDDFERISKKIGGLNFRQHILKELKVKIFHGKKFKDHRPPSEPSLFILSSGMLVENTPSYTIASCLLGDPKSSVCFVGFCEESTPGGKLLRCSKGDKFSFNAIDYSTNICADIQKFDLSGHTDREDLLNKVIHINPRSVVLTHGEEDARNWFFDNIIEMMPHVCIEDPEPGKQCMV